MTPGILAKILLDHLCMCTFMSVFSMKMPSGPLSNRSQEAGIGSQKKLQERQHLSVKPGRRKAIGSHCCYLASSQECKLTSQRSLFWNVAMPALRYTRSGLSCLKTSAHTFYDQNTSWQVQSVIVNHSCRRPSRRSLPMWPVERCIGGLAGMQAENRQRHKQYLILMWVCSIQTKNWVPRCLHLSFSKDLYCTVTTKQQPKTYRKTCGE